MSKVAEQVGIGAGLIGLSLFVPGGFLVATSLLTGVSGLASTLAVAGAGFVLSGAGTLLSQKATGIATTSRNPIAPWQVVYGRTKVGGTVVYQEEVANNNRILLMVVAVACHPCQEVEQVWFNNKKLQLRLNTDFSDTSNPEGFWQSFDPPQGVWQIETISRTNDVVSVTFTQNPNSVYSGFNGETLWIRNSRDAANGNSFDGYFPVVQTGPNSFTYTSGGPQGPGTGNPGTIKSTWPYYHGNVTVGYYKGDQVDASGIIFGNTVGYWTSDSKLSGRTYVALKLTYDSTVFSGLPEISFVLRGKNDIYDPRTKTKGYTNNAALVIADYLAQPLWGFKAAYSTQIPDAQLIAAANICDEMVPLALGGNEPRYTCDGKFDVSVPRGEVLQNLLTSCAGRLVYIGGQFIIQPGVWVTPSGEISVGTGNTGPKMMMNDKGLVAEFYNNPSANYIPDCAGTTESQFVYALGLLQAFQATGNSNAKALAQLILSALQPILFRGTPPPAKVSKTNIWSPDSFFNVKQPFIDAGGDLISVNQPFATDLASGWRPLATAEIQTNGDAYNWAMRLFALAAVVIDGVSQTDVIDLGYGLSGYGASYGDPELANPTINSGWLAALNAIQQMARIAYFINWPPTISGFTATSIQVQYAGGMIPFLAQFSGSPQAALTSWQGPAYTGMQSPWAIKQVLPTGIANAVQFLAEAQANLSSGGTVADTVTFTITGANPQTKTVAIEVNAAGNASASFAYAGTNVGTDTITATLPSHSLTSNAAKLAWSAYPAQIAVAAVQIAVMAADGSGFFNGAGPVLSTQSVQGLMFNSHPQSIFPGDPHSSGNQANPFVSNAVDSSGGYQGDLAIQNTGGRFNASMTGIISVSAAGTIQFNAYVNSRFLIGVQGATWVSGQQNFGPMAGGTALMGYAPLVGNNGGAWPGGNWAVVPFSLHFPAPGIYKFEINYASGLYSERQFALLAGGFGGSNVIPNIAVLDAGGTTATGTAPSGQLRLTPYSGGNALGQTATFALSLTGISYSGPSAGPFAPAFQYAVPAGVKTFGNLNSFGFFGPDPNYTAGYYQYRPLAELCDLIASANGTEPWYAQAVSVVSTFLTWIVGKWTTAATGPPNYFPRTGAQTTAVDVHCAALILYSALSLDLAARPMGAGGAGAMNTTQHALLNLVYALYQATYLTTGPMAGTFCIDPSGAQDWSPIWSGEILRALSMLVQWASLNAQPTIKAQAIVWINGLVNFGLNAVVVVDQDLGYTVDDLRAGVRWQPKLSQPDLYNGIKGTYVSEANQWQQADFPSYAQDALHGYTNGTPAHNYDANWDQDGERLWKDVQLPFTTSVSAAQRIAKIELMRIRQQGRGVLRGFMSMYKSAPLETIYFSFPFLMMVNKVLEIANTRLVMEPGTGDSGEPVTLLGTELDIQEADPSVYDWDQTSEELSAQGYSYVPGLSNQAPD